MDVLDHGIDTTALQNSGDKSVAQSFTGIAINVERLGKVYGLYDRPLDRLMQILRPGRMHCREFWALRHVDFEVRRGETVGIIGRNGTGKSTLLQIICGTLAQTEGKVELNGKVAALLELGAGFNPEFTGIENIYFSAALYGLTRESVDARLRDIINFADIGEHLHQAVKTYSSGMFVRLAFAVIAHVDASILVIDEALSVGDIFFQQKCLRHLRNFQEQGGTILFVSHDMPTVSALCTRSLLLRRTENGDRQSFFGDTKEITRQYLQDLYTSRDSETVTYGSGLRKAVSIPSDAAEKYDTVRRLSCKDISPAHYSTSIFSGGEGGFSTGAGRITDVYFADSAGQRLREWDSGEEVQLVICGQAYKAIELPAPGFLLKNRNGQVIFSESLAHYFTPDRIRLDESDQFRATFNLVLPRLLRGDYVLDIAFAAGTTEDHVQHHWVHEALLITVIERSLVQGVFAPHGMTIDFEILKRKGD